MVLLVIFFAMTWALMHTPDIAKFIYSFIYCTQREKEVLYLNCFSYMVGAEND